MSSSYLSATCDESLAAAGRHLIGAIRGCDAGPTLIFLGGIHGNEPAGVLACKRAISLLKQKRSALRGEVVFLAGNTRALIKGSRYVDADLNRQWASDRLPAIESRRSSASESLEKQELLTELENALARSPRRGLFCRLAYNLSARCPFRHRR